MTALGVLFDVDALESDFGYGYAAYRVLFEAVDAQDLAGCRFADGDVGANEYCIAIDSLDATRLSRIRQAVALSEAPGLRPLGVRFLGAEEVERVPLVHAARIDASGSLVDSTTPWIDRAWDDAMRERSRAGEVARHSAAAGESDGEDAVRSHPDKTTIGQDAPTREMPSPDEMPTVAFPSDRKAVEDDQRRPGGTIGGRYRILGVHRGGMGEVFIVENLESLRRGVDLRLALKTFQDRFLQNDDAIRRFEREALQWIHIDSHPNIVDAIVVERIQGKPYIWLECVDGESLAERIARGSLAIAEAVDLAAQFARGMSHAWQRHKLVHRDIKPANTMLTREGVLKITDFGLSKLRADLAAEAGEGVDWGSSSGSAPRLALTSQGRACGTPAYMAPEALDDPSAVDTRTDIYSFGVMLYEMLTGNMPFHGSNVLAIVEQHLHRTPDAPRALNPAIPARLDAIVLRCLEKRPENRFATFAEIEPALVEVGESLDGWNPIAVTERPRVGPMGKGFLRGTALMQFGRYEEALTAFEGSLDESSSDDGEIAIDTRKWLAETSNNMAVCLLHLHRAVEAESLAHRAVSLRPEYAEGWSNLGGIYGSLGRFREGVAACDRAIELKAEWAEAHANRGANLTGLGEYDVALEAIDRAIALDDHYWLAHVMAAEAKGYRGAPAEEILESLERALALEPRHAPALALSAACLAQLGRTDEARERLDRAIEIDPTHPRVVQITSVLDV